MSAGGTGGRVMDAVNEIGTVSDLLDSRDWGEVFGEGDGGNTDKSTMVIPPGAAVDPTPPMRSDVLSIVAAVNGENDGDAWVGVFLLFDGRYCIAEGGCDYTGWDCRAGNSLSVTSSLQNAIKYGLSPEQQQRLRLTMEKQS